MQPTSSKKTPLTFDAVTPGQGLAAALAKSRADIIGEVSASNLKGRGGAGFPTGTKWNLAAAAQVRAGGSKYVVCNADEGEPGTFKDRVLLLDYADLVFEGMTIAARAIGATKGILYLRAEYVYLRPHLEGVLARRRRDGQLGADILGTAGFTFDIEIRMGAGAYVCGEETALIESLEGHRGEPRNRPPFPVNTGFLGQPTVVNNVETLASVAAILAKGAAWFKAIGTEKSAGFKLFSVSGDCAAPGVYEFPLGITVRELVDAVGGAGAKAVQIGGASGVAVPASQFGRRIAFEDVATGGSIIVFGQGRDMLHVAKNFMEFFVEESCGQCTPCRAGNAKLLEGIEMLERGVCPSAYLNDLLGLCETMQLASKCGLGQSSPNAFMSIMTHFQDEILGRTAAAHERVEVSDER
jgi:[NiFe] hydrogenase diaphorase moiety large subunit